MSDVDTSKAELDLKNEKISGLEEKLKTFEDAEAAKVEADRLAAEEATKNEAQSVQDKLAKLEQDKIDMQTSFDKKLEDVKMRSSTQGKAPEGKKGLTKEEYLKDRVKYDTMFLKHTLPDVFGNQ